MTLVICIVGGVFLHTATLRKVGDSVMLAVPPTPPNVLRLSAGATVSLAVDEGRLVVERVGRPRYTLTELLAEAEAAGVYPVPATEREWINAPAVGKELG